MRIGEVARRAGVSVKAVRYYESLGLVAPRRLPNGYRDYGDHDVRLVREVGALVRLGIPAERTRPFVECLSAGRDHADDCPASLAGYRAAIDDLTRRIEELTARRATLAAHLRTAAYRGGGGTETDEDEDGMAETTYTTLPAGLPVPEDDGAADHLPGRAMPALTLTATSGEEVALDALGPGRTVLYLYPLSGRPDTDLPEGWNAIPGARGCTPEACGFRDHHQELTAAGATAVYGLSSQDTAYQREFAGRLRLPFAVLSDPGLELAAALDLPTFEAGGARLFRRMTLIVRDGVIEHVFHPVFPPDEHAGQVLGWLREH
ncbi:putative thiol-specific antioxidant related protein/Peroxidoxin BcpB [Streptomyces mashuensis]|uniref:Thiol-specific antioxidant related protein/Peroxidoxin BcpB n=1 Tax=Streptomyces mashuensis TaxID=33904 RepID=A0A919AW10_9ACTN|nr:redoxin family protein [Streptomyces mashuensis]GHF26243.1 putative thiol-specific antioxidant related protein/Peroxidoxin BcpB [Streptomyces mashuensis]